MFKHAQDNQLLIDFSDPSSTSALNNPSLLQKYASIQLKNIPDVRHLEEAFESIKNIASIESLIITDYEERKLPENFSNCKYLRRITLLNCKNIGSKPLFKHLGKLPALEVINLGNCKIDVIPTEVRQCTQLRSINISMNNMIDLPGTIAALSECPNLTTVSLPVNQISEIPENINQLRNLKELNISNNNLTDLPEAIGALDSLEKIHLEKNIVLNPSKSYQKISPISIKYLSIDEVSTEELNLLKERFPDAEIAQSQKPSLELYEMHQQIKDSIYQSLQSEETDEETSHVVQKRESINLRAYSLSYLQYSKIFDPMLSGRTLKDSLSFEERYLDTLYYNVYRRQEGLDFDGFYLKKARGNHAHEIWFDFEITEYFYYHFPEYFAFNDMSWVVVNPSTNKKEFAKKHLGKVKYADLRLYYDDLKKNFKLVLKTPNGFEELVVLPRFNKNKSYFSDEQSSYELRYIKYLDLLNKRAYKFNKELKEKQVHLNQEFSKIESKAWQKFSDLNLSQEEQQLTKEEWLDYYDEIIKNEEHALLNANMNAQFMLRFLKIKNFKDLSSSESTQKMYPGFSKVSFSDQDLLPLNITEIFVIDQKYRCYKHYPGSNAPMEFYLFHDTSPVTILAILRNGDFAIYTGPIKNIEITEIQLDILPANYTQLYDVMLQAKIL